MQYMYFVSFLVLQSSCGERESWLLYFYCLIDVMWLLLFYVLFVCFVALCPKSTAMVMAGRSVHLTTLFLVQA